MFCPHCGNPCDETRPFCQNCGNRIQEKPAQSAPPVNEPSTIFVDPTAPQPEEANGAASGGFAPYAPMGGYAPLPSVPDTLASLARSKSCLTGMIAYTVSVVLSLVCAALLPYYFTSTLPILIESFLYEFGDPAAYAELQPVLQFLPAFSAAIMVGLILACIPSALNVIGMWISRSAAVKGEQTTTGFTLLKIPAILQIIGCALGLCVTLISVVAAVISVLELGMVSQSTAEAVAMIVFLIFMLLIFGAVFILPLVFQAKVLKTLNVFKATVTTNVPNGNVSSFVIFACWAMGILSLMSVVSSIGSLAQSMLLPLQEEPELMYILSFLQPLLTQSIVSLIAGIASGIACIAFALFLGKYKETMNALQSPNPWSYPPTN